MEKDLRQLCKKISYVPNDLQLFERALTHASTGAPQNNERLEFLGDAVLELFASEYLYKRYPQANEGELTRMRAESVCESGLNLLAQHYGVGEYLRLGKSEEMNKGRQKPSILSDALEALIGAVYLDGGFEAARALVHLLLAKQEQLLEQTRPGRDAKTELQEYLQRSGSANLRYQVERVVGPPHAATFYISAVLNGTKISQGSGHSKKIAEQNAAQAALQKIYEENK